MHKCTILTSHARVQESVRRDFGKLLYQVLTMQYRDLVRPHMTGAKSVVDDFDLDRVCEVLELEFRYFFKTMFSKKYIYELFFVSIVLKK